MKGVTEATGSELAAYGAVALAAWRGHEGETSRLIDTTIDDVVTRGEGMGVAIGQFLAALLYNGLGRYAEALAAAEIACEYNDHGRSGLGADGVHRGRGPDRSARRRNGRPSND